MLHRCEVALHAVVCCHACHSACTATRPYTCPMGFSPSCCSRVLCFCDCDVGALALATMRVWERIMYSARRITTLLRSSDASPVTSHHSPWLSHLLSCASAGRVVVVPASAAQASQDTPVDGAWNTPGGDMAASSSFWTHPGDDTSSHAPTSTPTSAAGGAATVPLSARRATVSGLPRLPQLEARLPSEWDRRRAADGAGVPVEGGRDGAGSLGTGVASSVGVDTETLVFIPVVAAPKQQGVVGRVASSGVVVVSGRGKRFVSSAQSWASLLVRAMHSLATCVRQSDKLMQQVGDVM